MDVLRSDQNLIHLKKKPKDFADGIDGGCETERKMSRTSPKYLARWICHLQRWGNAVREAGLEVMDIGAEFDDCPLTMPNARPSEASSHQLNV